MLTAIAGAGPAVARGSATGAAEKREYVVLAADPANVAAAQAAVQRAGGTVVSVNTDVGLLTVESTNAAFAGAVRADRSVAGVARNRPIGEVPANQAKPRWEDIEKVTADRAAAKRQAQPANNNPRGEPLANLQWDMKMIGATPDGSYAINQGKRGVLVGIIDTGIDGSHPDLKPNFNRELSRNFTRDIPLIDGPCRDEPDKSCNDPNDVDEDGHGSHVAGTVAAAIDGDGIAGIAPGVQLVNLRAGQDSGFFFLGPTVDAITYAGRHGIDVVNMSFFTDPWLFNCLDNPADSPDEQAEQRTTREATQRAVNFARRNEVTLISALGNEHTDMGHPTIDEISPDFPPGNEKTRTVDNTCIDVPTESRGVISVSAIGPSKKKADYSNYGTEQTDFSAPGGFFRDFVGTNKFMTAENLILSPYPFFDAMTQGGVDPVTGRPLTPFIVADCEGPRAKSCTYWQYLQGTSMASPHAVGVAALVVSAHGHRDPVHGGLTLDPDQVEAIIKATATKTPCPAVNPVTYIAEGRDASFNALCEGPRGNNGIHGHGIVSALGAVQ